MTLATDMSAARIILWPGSDNEWYGFGMNGNTVNYNVPASATNKFDCGTTLVTTLNTTRVNFNTQAQAMIGMGLV